MSDCVFFYGTLMGRFNRPGRQRVERKMTFEARGCIQAALFDLGIYPAAVPSTDGSRVWGEVYRLLEPGAVLSALDEIEGYRPAEPERSLYIRQQTEVTLAGDHTIAAWAYFYNAPLGQAPRILSGDYLEYLNAGPQLELG